MNCNIQATRPHSHFYIVTPVYNCVEYIDETISSVITQTGNFSISYHIQDGGSTDGTVEKLKDWERRIAAGQERFFCQKLLFTWHSEKDRGMYDAINKGFYSLSPPPDGIMAWINADDTYLQYAFSSVAAAFADIPTMEWLGGTITVIRNNAILGSFGYAQPYPRELIQHYCCDDLHWRCIQQNGLFWKARLWDKGGPLNASLRYAGDFALWPKFAEYADFFHFPETLGTFRAREGQLSAHAAYGEEMEKICPRCTRNEFFQRFFARQRKLLQGLAISANEEGYFTYAVKKTFPPHHPRPFLWKRCLSAVLLKPIINCLRGLRKLCNELL